MVLVAEVDVEIVNFQIHMNNAAERRSREIQSGTDVRMDVNVDEANVALESTADDLLASSHENQSFSNLRDCHSYFCLKKERLEVDQE